MKTILIVMMILSAVISSYAQGTEMSDHDTLTTDSLVWHVYLAGKPSVIVMNAQQKAAAKRGVIIRFTTGDCTSKDNEKYQKEFGILNAPMYNYLNKKLGAGWEAEFNKEVG